MMASGFGEIVACIIRVPTENIKQNLQTPRYNKPIEAIKGIHSSRGFPGFFTGYFTTIMREIPFSIIQFPLWEKSKSLIASYTNKDECTSIQSALCKYK